MASGGMNWLYERLYILWDDERLGLKDKSMEVTIVGKKLYTSILLSILLSFMLTGCLAEDIVDELAENSDSEKYKTAYQLANERQAEIMECIEGGDKERLKSFFADDILKAFPHIDDDIDAALNFIDGEILWFGGQARYADTYANADFGYRTYGASNFQVETDKGTWYVISFWGQLSEEDPPKEEGVRCIRIKNISKDWPDMPNGWQEHWRDYKEYVYYIGEPCI